MTTPHDVGFLGIKIRLPKIRIKTPPFLRGALKVAGQGVSLTAGAVDGVGKLVGKIPVVGTPLHAVYDMGTGMPFRVADDIVKGKRIDRVAYNAFKSHVKSAQTLAPYAQMVVSGVPGIGTGAAGLIGAGYALSKGQPIDKAIVQGVRGALPGGPVAAAAFDVGHALMSGKPASEVGLAAIPLPDVQKQAIVQATLAVKDIAEGKRVDETLVMRGLNAAPPDIRRGLQVGIAIAEGQRLQEIAAKAAPAVMGKLAAQGEVAIKTSPVFSANGLKGSEGSGFRLGVGLLGHKATPIAVKSIRDKLGVEARTGFDVALAARIGSGKVNKPRYVHPREQFGYLVAVGSKDASPKLRREIAKTLAHDPVAKKGFRQGVKDEGGLWQKVLEFLGLEEFAA